MAKTPKKIVKAHKDFVNKTNGDVVVAVSLSTDQLSGIDLYRILKAKGFPQGGQGNWYIDEKTGERFYVPQPSEIYQHLIGDPKDWQIMVDYMARAWIELKK